MSDFLFSVDLEDPQGSGERLVGLTGLYLDFLARHGAAATFFATGEIARRYPELIRRIAASGHEIACHSDRHSALKEQDSGSFRDDLERACDSLRAAGAGEVRGYRAPFLSMVERTRWAYVILADLGFLYSSSVLPGRSPLYGWPGFGSKPRMIDNILEIPISVLPIPGIGLPAAGGVYFRVLPKALLAAAWRVSSRAGEPLVGYFHPYDLDIQAGWTVFPGYRRFGPSNVLLHFNRRAVLPRLERLIAAGFAIRPYREFASARAGGSGES
jgi:polysaccharide deacetylase family protein (PEP-CTERM system associated)